MLGLLGGVDENAARYLRAVQPSWGAPQDPLNNHGWILGDTSRISWQAQADIDVLLEQRDEGD